MSIVEQPQTFVQTTRAQRMDALMWIAQHAGVLADGYSISARSTFSDTQNRIMGAVDVQGEAGSMRALVALFGATRGAERADGYIEWRVIDEGVEVRFVEDEA